MTPRIDSEEDVEPEASPDEEVEPEDTHEFWATRSDEFSPGYYAEIGQNEVTKTIEAMFDIT